MLTDSQLKDYMKRLGLSDTSAQWIKTMRMNAPSRRAQGGRANVIGTYPSRKMGCSIQFESRTNEQSRIILFENDPLVFEFWDQPGAIKLSYLLDNGRKQSPWHTPDFFVLNSDACGWVECKKEQELITLVQECPWRYQISADGSWHCAPAEQVAAEYGFYYRILSSAGLNPNLITNLKFLKHYYETGEYPVATKIRDAVIKVVKQNPGILLSDVRARCPEASADDLNAIVASNAIFVDLSSAPLTFPDQVHAFRDSTLANAMQILGPSTTSTQAANTLAVYEGARLQWGEQVWTIITLSDGKVLLHGNENDREVHPDTLHHYITAGEVICLDAPQINSRQREKAEAVLRRCTTEALEECLRRYSRFQNPESFLCLPDRTRERWRAKIRMGEADYGEQYKWVGLMPKHFEKG